MRLKRTENLTHHRNEDGAGSSVKTIGGRARRLAALALLVVGALEWGILALGSYLFAGGFLSSPITFGGMATNRVVEALTGIWSLVHLALIGCARAYQRPAWWNTAFTTVMWGNALYLGLIGAHGFASGGVVPDYLVPWAAALIAAGAATLLLTASRGSTGDLGTGLS